MTRYYVQRFPVSSLWLIFSYIYIYEIYIYITYRFTKPVFQEYELTY